MRYAVIALSLLFVAIAYGFLPEFEYSLTVLSIDSADTSETILTFGLNDRGTDLYDSGYDTPQLLLPGISRAYFPIFDSSHPEVPALSTDIRGTDYSIHYWTIDVFEPGSELVLCWDYHSLPHDTLGFLEFAVVDSGTYPSSAVYGPMCIYSSTNFDAGEVVYIRSLPGVNRTPYCEGIYPSDGDTVSPDTCIHVSIHSGISMTDSAYMSIDSSSIVLSVNGLSISHDECLIEWYGFFSYTVTYCGPFIHDEIYIVSVTAGVLGSLPYVVDTSWVFYTNADAIAETPQFPESFEITTYPNPFNSSVTISVSVIPGLTRNPEIEIFDIAGRMVAQIPAEAGSVIPDPDRESSNATKNLDSRFHGNDRVFVWTPSPTLPSGVYLLRARFGDQSLSKKVAYLK